MFSLAGILPAKYTDKSRQLFPGSRENMEKITNAFSFSTINCSPQVIPVHPKDKVDPSPKKDIVYQWSCTKPNCKSSYIRETSRSLCECVKEHSKEGSNSAIYQYCSTKGHPLPNIDQFKIIDQEKSQIAHEAKEAIHI